MAQVEATTVPSLTPRSELLASLEKHNASFTTLLSLIPAQFYIQQTPEEVSHASHRRERPRISRNMPQVDGSDVIEELTE